MTEPDIDDFVDETEVAPAGAVGAKAAARIRRDRACNMALAGYDYEEIARACGYSNKATARRQIEQALSDRSVLDPTLVERVREQELLRLDRLQAGLWVNALRGDTRAADSVLRIMQHRAKLLGLEAPTKIDAQIKEGLDKEIEHLLSLMPRADKG